MSIPSPTLSIPSPQAANEPPSFIVGQDPEGHWVAVETHGLCGGLFRSCKDAIHYAATETQRRPDSITIATDWVEFRM